MPVCGETIVLQNIVRELSRFRKLFSKFTESYER
jgi:hypothetical protein